MQRRNNMASKAGRKGNTIKKHPDLYLAQKAKLAREKNIKTNNPKHLKKAISLYSAAAKKAKDSGHNKVAVQFETEARRLQSILETFHTEKKQ